MITADAALMGLEFGRARCVGARSPREHRRVASPDDGPVRVGRPRQDVRHARSSWTVGAEQVLARRSRAGTPVELTVRYSIRALHNVWP